MALSHPKSLRWLLDRGADPDTTVHRAPCESVTSPRTLLACAAGLDEPTSLELLFEYGATMDPEALHHSIGPFRGHRVGPAAMLALLKHGADVNYVSRHRGRPLYHAVRCYLECRLRILLEHGADPDVVIRCWRIPTSARKFAKEKGEVEMVRIMEEKWGREAEEGGRG